MYTIDTTKKFEKDFKLCLKRGLPMEELKTVIEILRESGTLPQVYHPHKLQNDSELKMLMLRTGSHADIF